MSKELELMCVRPKGAPSTMYMTEGEQHKEIAAAKVEAENEEFETEEQTKAFFVTQREKFRK